MITTIGGSPEAMPLPCRFPREDPLKNRMDTLLDRFVRYAKLDTQASEFGTSYPSTPKQLNLCRLLAGECSEIGLSDVAMSDFGVVTATLPATVKHKSPAIAWFAHVDTSSEFTAENVNPTIHRNYAAKDIVLP